MNICCDQSYCVDMEMLQCTGNIVVPNNRTLTQSCSPLPSSHHFMVKKLCILHILATKGRPY